MTAREKWLGAGTAVLAGLGIWLRLWHLFADPLWLDEAYSAFAADHGFRFLWQVVPRYEAHPPAYYSLLRLWVLVAGDGLVALRLVGLAAGLLTLPLLGLGAARFGELLGWNRSRRLGAAATAVGLGSLSFPLVEMARQVRPYPVMILVCAAALPLLAAARRTAAAGCRTDGTTLAGLLLVEEALLWLHNLGPLFAAGVALALLLLVARRGMAAGEWLRLLAGQLLVGLLYLPGFAMLLAQAPTWAASTWVRLQPAEVWGRLQMLYGGAGAPMLAVVLLVLFGVGVCRRGPGGWRVAAALGLLALWPVLCSLLLSVTLAPVFVTRTMTPVAAPALVLYALGVAGSVGWARRVALSAAGLLAATGLIVGVQARLAGPMEDWSGAVDWLRLRVRPGDVVFAYPNEGALPLARALRDRGYAVPIRAVPVAVPALTPHGGWFPTGYKGPVSLPPARLRAIAALPATHAVPTIWLLRLGPQTYDRGDAALAAFHVGRFAVRRWQRGAIDLVGLRRLPAGARIRSSPAPVRSRR